MSGQAELLEQFIRSNDPEFINRMLTKFDPESIPALVKDELPSTSISVFLKALTRHIQRVPQSLKYALPWFEQLIMIRKNDIAASIDCQRKVLELQNILKQRTQQIGIFTEVYSLSTLVQMEKDGLGIGLPVVEDACQELTE